MIDGEIHTVELVPQITASESGLSEASLYGAFPAQLRDALRKAGSRGLYWFQLADSLGADVKADLKRHASAMNNALEYLVTVGLIRRDGARYFDIPLITKQRSNP